MKFFKHRDSDNVRNNNSNINKYALATNKSPTMQYVMNKINNRDRITQTIDYKSFYNASPMQPPQMRGIAPNAALAGLHVVEPIVEPFPRAGRLDYHDSKVTPLLYMNGRGTRVNLRSINASIPYETIKYGFNFNDVRKPLVYSGNIGLNHDFRSLNINIDNSDLERSSQLRSLSLANPLFLDHRANYHNEVPTFHLNVPEPKLPRLTPYNLFEDLKHAREYNVNFPKLHRINDFMNDDDQEIVQHHVRQYSEW